MDIVFMGTPQFAVISLRKLLAEKLNIKAVVTAVDKPSGRGRKIQYSAVKEFAINHQLPLLQPDNLTDPEFIDEIKSLRPELILVVAFRILPPEIFTIPPRGTINLHASLLPKYRGAAPINWAIINGETETGVTTFFIDQKVDTGLLIASRKVEIQMDTTAGELHDRLALVGAECLVETVHLIQSGKVQPIVQEDQNATRAPKIFPQDCEINFNQPSQRVHNFIRGLSPYPSAFTYLKGIQIRLFSSKASEISSRGAKSGEIIAIPDNKTLRIQCSSGSIDIAEIQLAGKRRMSVADFLRGNPVFEGDLLGNGK